MKYPTIGKASAIATGAVVAVAVGGGVALATTSPSPAVISTCYHTSVKGATSLERIAPGASCPSGYTKLNWNVTGVQGPAGPAGATGATGPAGTMGATGPAGPAGATGIRGATGATGATGPAGTAGLAGPAGAPGTAGAAGPAGPAGKEVSAVLTPGFTQGGTGYAVPGTLTSVLATGDIEVPGTYFVSAELSFYANQGDTTALCEIAGDSASAQAMSVINDPYDDPVDNEDGPTESLQLTGVVNVTQDQLGAPVQVSCQNDGTTPLQLDYAGGSAVLTASPVHS